MTRKLTRTGHDGRDDKEDKKEWSVVRGSRQDGSSWWVGGDGGTEKEQGLAAEYVAGEFVSEWGWLS